MQETYFDGRVEESGTTSPTAKVQEKQPPTASKLQQHLSYDWQLYLQTCESLLYD